MAPNPPKPPKVELPPPPPPARCPEGGDPEDEFRDRVERGLEHLWSLFGGARDVLGRVEVPPDPDDAVSPLPPPAEVRRQFVGSVLAAGWASPVWEAFGPDGHDTYGDWLARLAAVRDTPVALGTVWAMSVVGAIDEVTEHLLADSEDTFGVCSLFESAEGVAARLHGGRNGDGGPPEPVVHAYLPYSVARDVLAAKPPAPSRWRHPADERLIHALRKDAGFRAAVRGFDARGYARWVLAVLAGADFGRLRVELQLEFVRGHPPGPHAHGCVRWSRPAGVKHWAKVFRVHWNTMSVRLRSGAIHCRKFSPRLWQIAVDDLPDPDRR